MLTEKEYGGVPPLAAMVQPAYAWPCVPPGHEVVVIAKEPPDDVIVTLAVDVVELQPANPKQANRRIAIEQRFSTHEWGLRGRSLFLQNELAEFMRFLLLSLSGPVYRMLQETCCASGHTFSHTEKAWKIALFVP